MILSKKYENYRPKLYYSRIWMIDFEHLRSKGIKYLLIDVDSTIADHHSSLIDERAKDALLNAMKTGRIENCCLVSNVMFGRRKKRRVANMANELGIPFVAASFYHAKPGSSPFRKGLQLLDAKIKETAVIGDQMFTDILGGNKMGLFTILVRPLGRVHWTTKISLRRMREKKMIKKLGLELSDVKLPRNWRCR